MKDNFLDEQLFARTILPYFANIMDYLASGYVPQN